MVAIVSSFVFAAAIGVALFVIGAMVAAERARIVGLLDGSLRPVALPDAIRVKRDRRPQPRSVASPLSAMWRAAA